MFSDILEHLQWLLTPLIWKLNQSLLQQLALQWNKEMQKKEVEYPEVDIWSEFEQKKPYTQLHNRFNTEWPVSVFQYTPYHHALYLWWKTKCWIM